MYVWTQCVQCAQIQSIMMHYFVCFIITSYLYMIYIIIKCSFGINCRVSTAQSFVIRSLSDISTLSLELLWKSFFQKYKSLHSYKVPEFQYNINTVGEYNLQRNFEAIYLHNIAKFFFFFQDNYILSTIPFLHGCCVNVTLRMTSSQRG